MDSDDVLGDDGRKALDACVKVKIVCIPEVPEYDRGSALEQILSCYAGTIPKGLYEWSVFDPLTLFDVRSGHNVAKMKRSYNIIEIYDALINFDEVNYVQRYPKESHRSDEHRELIDKRRADVKKEHSEASKNPEKRHKYSLVVAQRRVRDCFAGNFAGDGPVLERKQNNEPYSINEIYQAVVRIHEEGRLSKYDPDGHLKQMIDENWNNLIKEHEEALESYDAIKHEYSWSEAELRVRNCFAGTLKNDADIFPREKQSYDIFDIKKAIEHFDTKTILDAFKYASKRQLQQGYATNQKVDEERASIQEEYDKAISRTEIEHGSGFIVHGHFVITNKHVIDTYLNETDAAVQSKDAAVQSKQKWKYEIYISNAEIGELSCTKVVHNDAEKDLALLYCPDLNLEQCKIWPLQLSNQSLLPGMSIFCFGYPMSHTEETALVVTGNVSGSKRRYGRQSMVVLNCSLNSGNSGGPVLRWVNGELKVVGVATQKHFKEILTSEEIETIENIRESLQTKAISDVPDHVKQFDRPVSDYYMHPTTHQMPMTLLTLKLYDALETHSQFNLSNALPGSLVVDFMKDSINEYTGEHKEELAEIVKLAS